MKTTLIHTLAAILLVIGIAVPNAVRGSAERSPG